VAAGSPASGYAGPRRYDVGDVIGSDLFLHQQRRRAKAVIRGALAAAFGCFLRLGLDGRDLAVEQPGRGFQVLAADRLLRAGFQVIDLGLQGVDLVPTGLFPRPLLLQVAEPSLPGR
jgi:hypothetical protein